MKVKKLLMTAMLAPSILSAVSCGNNKSSSDEQDKISFTNVKANASLEPPVLYTTEGKQRLNSDPTDQSLVDSIL